MSTKFKVIIEDGNAENGITRHVIDCEHLDEAIREYRKALDTNDQSQITSQELCRNTISL